MKILVYRWNAWNQRDLEESLHHKGYDISPVSAVPHNIEEDDAFVEALVCQLKSELPQFLFSINYFPVLAQAAHLTGIPYVCWNCDGSLLSMYDTSIFYDTNFLFTFDRACVSRFQQIGLSQIWYLPLGVNARRLQQVFAASSPFAGESYDISFVGSLYEKNSYDEIAHLLPPYLAGYLEGALTAQQAISGGNILKLLLTPPICEQLEEVTSYHRSEHSFAGISQLFSSTVLGFKAANQKRCEILNTLSKEGKGWQPAAQVHLFTTDTARELPLVSLHPPVDYFQEMPWIFQNTAINLHSTIPTIETGISLRIWDVLGSGGFLLTDYREDLLEFFQSEKYLSVYEDTEELTAKAEFYLQRDTLRQDIAKRAQKLVLENHTWDIRIDKMLHTLKPFSFVSPVR